MPQYEVQAGDNLYAIAEKTLGDGNRWREIYEGNAQTVGDDPGLVRPGQVLAIPYDQPAHQQGGDYQGPQIQPSGPSGFGAPAPQQAPMPANQTQDYWNQEYSNDPQVQANRQSTANMNFGLAGAANSPTIAGSRTRPSQFTPPENNVIQGGRTRPSSFTPPAAPTGPTAYGPIGARPYNSKIASGFDQARGNVVPPPQPGPVGARPYNSPVASGFDQARGNVQPQQTFASRNQQQVQAAQNPSRNNGYDVTITDTAYPMSPTARQEMQARGPVRVEWPVAPGVMQQGLPQGVTPSSFQGRFTDQQGRFSAPNAASGYMGRPNQGTPPPQQQTFVPTGQRNPPSQTMPQMQGVPRAVIVVAEDGTQMVYNPRTGEWRQTGQQGMGMR